MNRAFGISGGGDARHFNDVQPSDWFYADVMSAGAAGYISGYSDGTFRPDNIISRQEAASIISRVLNLSPGDQAVLAAFEDQGSIDQWARPGLSAVIVHGIMSGFNDKTIQGKKNLTRAEAVAALDRSLDYRGEADLIPPEDPASSGRPIGGGNKGGNNGGGNNGGGNNGGDDNGQDPPGEPIEGAAVNGTVATNIFTSTGFLYSGDNPVQTGMAAGTIEENRAAVIRGRVLDRNNDPLTGVEISISDHNIFGKTLSGTGGYFDMAVNGGNLMTVNYKKEGYIPAQRQIQVPWQDFAMLPDVVLIPYDTNKTVVSLTPESPMQVARGSEVTDNDGSRKATLIMPAGVTARLDDGTPLDSMTVRATEYSVGANGPKAMPAVLPPNVAYTYCVEYSADEAIAARSKNVFFDKPIYHYVENFIGFPVGGIVPMGYYDYDKAAWIPSENGVVIKILSINGGMAELDIDGSGNPANAVSLASKDISDEERRKLAEIYTAGQELWRVPITHFTPWDCNWPFGPPLDARGPRVPIPKINTVNDPCRGRGSIIEYQNQALGEEAMIYGTNFTLNYNSSRAEGYKQLRSIEIPISESEVPASLKQIYLEVRVAGRLFKKTFEPISNQSFTYTWDGKNPYGQTVQGSTPIHVSIGYEYNASYYAPEINENAFGNFGEPFPVIWEVNRQGATFTAWQNWTGVLSFWDSAPSGIGGWSLDVHHAYVPGSGILYLGDGSRSDAGSSRNIITTVTGTASSDNDSDGFLDGGYSGDSGPAVLAELDRPFGVATGPDGSIFIADGYNNRIRKISPDGIITTIAGNPSGNELDNGPAKLIKIGAPMSIALGPDGSIYFAENARHRIRKIDPQGTLSVIAGTGLHGLSGDGGPAKDAKLNSPRGIAVASDGSIYIADTNNHRIRRIDPNGIISTIAGVGTGFDGGGYGGDGGPAAAAQLTYPQGIALDPDGNIYIADTGNNGIRRIGVDGTISRFAGGGLGGFSGDGGQAANALLNNPNDIEIAQDGSIYISDYRNNRIRKVAIDGTISTVAGSATDDANRDGYEDGGYAGEGGIATEAQLRLPSGIALTPNGGFYIADTYNHRIRRVGQPFRGDSVNEHFIADQTGGKFYVFDTQGRHKRTISAMTGNTIYTFSYNEGGQLTGVTDVFGNKTTIGWDEDGNPIEITAPGGQKTFLSVNENGYLSSISCPYDIPIDLEYTSGNLLTVFSDHKKNIHKFTYDNMGRLIKDEDPAGGFTQLSRSAVSGGYIIQVRTAEGRESSYKVENIAEVGSRRTDTDQAGGKTISEINDDGSRRVTYSDGTVVTMVTIPDPRPGIGIQAPITSEFIIKTPGGLELRTTSERSLEFEGGDDGDIFKINKITDKVAINGKLHTTTYDIDRVEEKITVTDITPEGRESTNILDWHGRITKTMADDLEATVYGYNEKGHLASVTRGDQSINYVYDGMNRLISFKDAGGAEFKYTYNNADVLKSITMPDGQAYLFGNDYNGNVTKVTMPDGAVHELGYTAIDQSQSYAPPENAAYERTYDKDRALTKFQLPGGREMVFSYDEAGRVTGIKSGAAAVLDEEASAFNYMGFTDRIANIGRSRDGNINLQNYSYNYDGALITGMAASGDISGSYQYRYDNTLKLVGRTLNDDPEFVLAYDDDGLLTKYGDFTIQHEGPLGATSRMSDGVFTTAYTYDTYGRTTGRSTLVAGENIYNLGIAYDNTGIITARTEQTGDLAPVAYNYTYDGNKQLTGVSGGSAPEVYTYDVNGNRKSGGAVYDAQDRLTQLNGVSYEFNNDGYLTKRGDDSFDYTARGELSQARVDGLTFSYAYDGLGRRLGRTVNRGTEELPDIDKEYYLYGNLNNPFQITAIKDDAGTLSEYYYDQFNCLVAIKKGGTIYYVATDQQGTPKVVSDVAGNIIKTMEYDGYGRIIDDSNPGFNLPIGYGGGISDSDTGLVNFGMRDYDPAAGRWTARDPIFFDGHQGNLYVYVGNNPVNLRDPSGLFCIGGSAYAGFGGGGQFCISGEGISVCAEVGFGVGTSVEVNPFQGLAENSSEVGIQLGVGPASGELTLDDCGNLRFTTGIGVGPFSKSATYDFLDGKWSGNAISVGIDPTGFGGKEEKSKGKVDISGKVYGRKCLRI